jgi:hypothetical protein
MTEEQAIRHFVLPRILPDGHCVALHQDQGVGILVHLSCEAQGPRLLGTCLFTPSEVSVLSPLLEHYPYFCPYAVLLASFYGSTEEAAVARAYAQLEQAKEGGRWDSQMRPVRNVLSRARLRLNRLGITILSLFETGYTLMPARASRDTPPRAGALRRTRRTQ